MFFFKNYKIDDEKIDDEKQNLEFPFKLFFNYHYNLLKDYRNNNCQDFYKYLFR